MSTTSCHRCGMPSSSLRKTCPNCKGSKRIHAVSVQDATASKTIPVSPNLTTFRDILRQFSAAVGATYFALYDEDDRCVELGAVVTEKWLDSHNGYLTVLSKEDQFLSRLSPLAREIRESRRL